MWGHEHKHIHSPPHTHTRTYSVMSWFRMEEGGCCDGKKAHVTCRKWRCTRPSDREKAGPGLAVF